jgi:Ubiquitin family
LPSCILGAGEGKGQGGQPTIRPRRVRVQVTVNGEVLYISNVATVSELQQRLWEESGWDESQQGRATFQGQVLEPDDLLSSVGVQDGNQINMVPKSFADHWKLAQEMGKGLEELRSKLTTLHNPPPHRFEVVLPGISPPPPTSSNDDNDDSSTTTSTAAAAAARHHHLRDLQDFRMLSELYQDMIKFPYLQNEMERISKKLQQQQQKSSLPRYNDPERIETIRQIVLNNPMMLSTLQKSSPRMKAALENSTAWLQLMQVAVARWKTMDGYQLWQQVIHGTLFDEE